ncbi:hypothetical protein [Pseudogemmobacter humi]|nr:hypothetical protein [Pseudogemmobacter humi]
MKVWLARLTAERVWLRQKFLTDLLFHVKRLLGTNSNILRASAVVAVA